MKWLRRVWRKKLQQKVSNDVQEQDSATGIQSQAEISIEDVMQQVPKFSFGDLGLLTDNFGESTFIVNFQFGKVYRGRIPEGWKGMPAQVVTVKLWKEVVELADDKGSCLNTTTTTTTLYDNQSRLTDEITFLSHPSVINHGNLPKIMGYCWESENLGIVYALNPLETLQKLVDQDCIRWLDRMKLAYRLACLIEFLHCYEPHYLVRNISTAHVMLDQGTNPILFDFGMLIGGVLHPRNDAEAKVSHGFPGYIDPCFSQTGNIEEFDIYSLGILLMALVCKRDVPLTCQSNVEEAHIRSISINDNTLNTQRHNRKSFSVVHETLQREPYFYEYDGHKISKLIIRCLDGCVSNRPTISEVVCRLRDIRSLAILVSEEASNNESDLVVFSYDDLIMLTANFSEDNFLGKTQFGEVYRGWIQQGWKGLNAEEVVVKTWLQETSTFCEKRFSHTIEDNICRFRDEILFLRHPSVIGHANLAKLMGYCFADKHLGVVYKVKPLDTLQNMLLKDSFQWTDRVKVVLQLACLVEFMHSYSPPFMIRNLSAFHIILDQGLNVILVDIGMLVGGVSEGKKGPKFKFELGAFDHIEDHFCMTGIWTKQADVFAYGVIVFGLLCKQNMSLTKNRAVPRLLAERYDAFKWSFFKSVVHESLERDPFFHARDAHRVSLVAMRCVLSDRPMKMSQVVFRLKRLRLFF